MLLRQHVDGMWTASVYKLFMLEILLQLRLGRPAHRRPTPSEATPMIENSDNVAGRTKSSRTAGTGGAGVLADGFEEPRTHSTPSPVWHDPAFTTTSAMDCIKALLKNLVRQRGRSQPAGALVRGST